MEFLLSAAIYFLFSSFVFLVYWFQESLAFRPVFIVVGWIRRILGFFIPTRLKKLIWRLLHWFLFERHCIYQVVYFLLILISHSILITDVISVLYQFSEKENNLFIGLACLFCSCLSYATVCLTDPGVVNSRNLSVYSQFYPYDGLIYRPIKCLSCSHIMPARCRHCVRCDHCVFRMEHHCVWTNCCIGGHNAGYFVMFLLSSLVMTLNATWLCFKMLRKYVEMKGLWAAQYVDDEGMMHPMDWPTIIQHLFMSFPRVVGLGCTSLLLSAPLTGYVGFHLWLLCTNRTTYEYWRLSKLRQKTRIESGRESFHLSMKMHSYDDGVDEVSAADGYYTGMPPIEGCSSSTSRRLAWNGQFYDRGLWGNLSEVLGYHITDTLRELRRKVHPQMEFRPQ